MSGLAFRTLCSNGIDEFVVNKSRFIGIGVPVESEGEALERLRGIRDAYPSANHHCYAYIVGTNSGIMRYSDDGEPGGTAGMPIIEVMKAHRVTNALVVVVRYFGGILLGAGGLLRAYTQGAKVAVLSAGIGVVTMTSRYLIEVHYGLLGKVEYFLKDQPVMIDDKAFTDVVVFTLRVRNSDAGAFGHALVSATEGVVHPIFIDEEYFMWPVDPII